VVRSSAATPAGASGASTIDWVARRKQRTTGEVFEAARKAGMQCTKENLGGGMQQLEDLIPGFTVDLEVMKASQWASLFLNVPEAAIRIVALKGHYPKADLARILQQKPQLMLADVAQLQSNAKQVKQLLQTAQDMDALLTELPGLLDPSLLISVLVTVDKWYFNKKDPVAVIEADPDLIRRAQACDIPFEPVYVDKDGSWMAPSLNYKEKRADWQAYIDKNVYKQTDPDIGGSTP